MISSKSKVIGSPSSLPLRGASLRLGRKAKALTLVLLGTIGVLAAVTGPAKDRTPKTRTVRGVVFDDAQTPIDGAMVELTDLQTNKVWDIYSQEDGTYQFTDIRFDHDYTVQAKYKGGSSEVRKVSMFETRWTLDLNLTIAKPQK